MIITLIAAVAENGGIGFKNRLPWYLPDDLKRFKSLTLGHYLIAGRKTWESIGNPLPGRKILVVSRQTGFQAPGCTTVSSLAEGLRMAENGGESECFIIGGAQIFTQALPLAHRLYLTRVHAVVEADVYFPTLNVTEWLETNRQSHPVDERHEFPFTFIDLQKRDVTI
jgi:dihydrofolate reductase